MLTELGMVLLLTITIVGIPFAIRRFVRWSLFAEACMLEDPSARDSLSRSSELVKVAGGARSASPRSSMCSPWMCGGSQLRLSRTGRYGAGRLPI